MDTKSLNILYCAAKRVSTIHSSSIILASCLALTACSGQAPVRGKQEVQPQFPPINYAVIENKLEAPLQKYLQGVRDDEPVSAVLILRKQISRHEKTALFWGTKNEKTSF